MFSPALFLSTTFLMAGVAPPPAYMMKIAETQRIEAVLRYQIEMPKLAAQEWIVFAVRPPELPGQVRVSTTLEPGGKPAFELSADHRPIVTARIAALGVGREKEITVHVKYEATLRSRRLVPLKRGGGIRADGKG